MRDEVQNNCLRKDSCDASSELQSPFKAFLTLEAMDSQPKPVDGAGTRSSNISDTLPSSPEIPEILTSQKYQAGDRPQSHCLPDHNQHPKKISKLPPLIPRTQAKLEQARQIRYSKASISARTKDLRLKGADLYVARLGHDCKLPNSPAPLDPLWLLPPPVPLPKVPSHNGPKSLHDELRLSTSLPQPKASHASASVASPTTTKPQIRASRPCHRCITHMHAAGIARAFWTNAHGEWEGAKVRDLMDALEGDFSGSSSNGGDDGKGKNTGVFVTKHEILMLRRVMGC
jgi:hypothetical protein